MHSLSHYKTLFLSFFWEESDRLVLWVPVFFGTGTFLYLSFPYEPSLFWSASLFALTLALFFSLKRPFPHAIGTFCFLCVTAGFLLVHVKASLLQTPILPFPLSWARIAGDIASIELRPNNRYRILLTHTSIAGIPQKHTPRYLSVSTPATPSLASFSTGDTITFKASLFPPSPPSLPGGYNFSRDAFFRNVGATGYTTSTITQLTPFTKDTFSLASGFARLRSRLAHIIASHLPSPAHAITIALLIGQQEFIPPATIEHMRHSGLSHLLSVSGLHMTLVGGLFFLLFRGLCSLSTYLTLHFPIKKWAACFAILGSFFYLCLTGFSIPAQRSFLMTAVLFISILYDRQGISIRSLAFATLCILLVFPESIVTASFQMSFSASLALIALYEKYTPHGAPFLSFSLPARLWRYFFSLFMASLVATLATLPFTIYHFHQFALYGVLANLVAVPLTTFLIMPFGFLSLFLIPLHLEALPLFITEKGITFLLDIAAFFSSLPYATHPVTTLSSLSLLCTVAGGVWIMLWQKKWRWWGLIPAGIGLGITFLHTPVDIIIDGKTGYFIVKEEDSNFSSPTPSLPPFLQEQWQNYTGSTTIYTPKNTIPTRSHLQCNGNYCQYDKDNHHIAFVLPSGKPFHGCHHYTMVVYTSPLATGCYKPLSTIRWDDLEQKGTHTLTLYPDRINIKNSVNPDSKRLWGS